MDMGLGGRGYLPTGASRGLGSATARALVDGGDRVPTGSRSADAVATAADRLGGAPGAHGIAAGPADPDAAGFARAGVASALRPAAADASGTMIAVDGGATRAP